MTVISGHYFLTCNTLSQLYNLRILWIRWWGYFLFLPFFCLFCFKMSEEQLLNMGWILSNVPNGTRIQISLKTQIALKRHQLLFNSCLFCVASQILFYASTKSLLTCSFVTAYGGQPQGNPDVSSQSVPWDWLHLTPFPGTGASSQHPFCIWCKPQCQRGWAGSAPFSHETWQARMWHHGGEDKCGVKTQQEGR